MEDGRLANLAGRDAPAINKLKGGLAASRRMILDRAGGDNSC